MVIKFSAFTKGIFARGYISFICCLLCRFSFAQVYNGASLQSPQLAFECKLQPQRPIKDSTGYSYASQEYGFNAIIPVFTKRYLYDEPERQKKLGVFLTPILRFNNTHIDYLYDSRVLINAGIGIGVYYSFKLKHTLMGFIQPQINEDEFSIADPVLRYSGTLIYTHKSSEKFSYFLGATYTYLLGGIDRSTYVFPVIGARFKTGEKSSMNVLLPFTIAYTARFNKWRLLVSLKPNGGINRYENRYGFATDANEIILRRRSFVAGVGAYYRISPNFSLGVEAGLVFGRQLAFTSEDQSITYTENTIANGAQFTIKGIWKPWQNTLRNKKKQSVNTPEDANGDNDLFVF